MKKNIAFLVGGIVAGIALCLTAAKLIPVGSDFDFDDLIGSKF
jgi:hypothetical protein